MPVLKNILFALLLVVARQGSAAARIYHCAGGHKQDRPCSVRVPQRQTPQSLAAQPERAAVGKVESSRAAPPQSPNDHYARVLEQNFSRINSIDGLWSGRVEGNGLVHLELQILRNGTFESRRYMGGVNLVRKSTGFRFRSTVPKGEGWSWAVIAFAS